MSHDVIKNSSLRMAVVLGDRLFQGIKYEGEILKLTPARWCTVLEYGKVDILLIESVERTFDGLWNTSTSANENQQNEIVNIVKFARSKLIPTVYWITVGHNELEKYRKTADLFDLVACSDQLSVQCLLQSGLNAIYLPPCVQPAIFNQYHYREERLTPSYSMLFDKGTDLYEFDIVESTIEDLKHFGLCVIEVRSERHLVDRTQERTDLPASYSSDVSSIERLCILKRSKAYVTFENSLSSWTEQQWMILEAISCGLPVVHFGQLKDDDILNGIITNCFSVIEFKSEFYKYSIDELYRKRVAHIGWRMVLGSHTYSHRINNICNALKVSHDWVEFPKASIICPTNKSGSIDGIINTFRNFNYPEKELVIIDASGSNEVIASKKINDNEMVQLINIPPDRFAGSALNYGRIVASGKLCFRIDDDDIYGQNYILDYVLNTRSINAEVYGKCPSPITFEHKNDGIAYVKEWDVSYMFVDPCSCIQNKIWLGGNTFMIKREFALKNPFSDRNYGSADTDYLLCLNDICDVTIVFIDDFNIVAVRREDVASHTWRENEEQIVVKRVEKRLLDNLFV